MTKLEKLVESYIKIYMEQKHKIEEMADDKQQIIRDLKEGSKQIKYHLISCFLWSNSEYVPHWEEEIFASISEISKFKNTNKFPTMKQLNKWFLETQLEKLEYCTNSDVETVCYKEHQDIPNYDEKKLIEFMSDYFIWLCENLSQYGYIRLKATQSKIDELLSKYK